MLKAHGRGLCERTSFMFSFLFSVMSPSKFLSGIIGRVPAECRTLEISTFDMNEYDMNLLVKN